MSCFREGRENPFHLVFSAMVIHVLGRCICQLFRCWDKIIVLPFWLMVSVLGNWLKSTNIMAEERPPTHGTQEAVQLMTARNQEAEELERDTPFKVPSQ